MRSTKGEVDIQIRGQGKGNASDRGLNLEKRKTHGLDREIGDSLGLVLEKRDGLVLDRVPEKREDRHQGPAPGKRGDIGLDLERRADCNPLLDPEKREDHDPDLDPGNEGNQDLDQELVQNPRIKVDQDLEKGGRNQDCSSQNCKGNILFLKRNTFSLRRKESKGCLHRLELT